MRNLKRALSLTLASIMLLGMMVVGSSAAGFPDVDDDNASIEAIEVLKAVEVMVGDDNGNFGPNDLVNRSQMAVVMAKLLHLDYKYYEASCPFWDVPTWARGYVGACYANKIVSGYGDGTYGAADPVTAVQAASMMMRALGYFQYAEDYKDGFETVTVRQGTQIGIFKGLTAKSNENLTRSDVAQMALNALESEMVTFTGTPGTTYTASNGETLSIGYVPKYESRTSTELKYKAIEDRTSDASLDSNHRGQYYIQLGEELFDGKLTKKYARDDFMRPSINWQYDGKEIGTYVDYELKKAEYTTGVTGATLYDELTYTTIRDYDLYSYVDGVDDEIKKEQLVRSNKKDVGHTGKGVLTEVFVDQDRDEITITSINTWLAKANSDYNKTNESLSLKVFTGSGSNKVSSTTQVVDSAEVAYAEGVKKDDFTLVYMSGKEKANKIEDYNNYTVVKMFDVTMDAAASVTKFSTSSSKVVDKLTTGGTEYGTNVKAFYDFGNALYDYDAQLLTDMTYNIFFDRYENVIGVELDEGTKNYVFITGYDRIASHISVKTAQAAAIFLDGTMDEITVNVTETNKKIDVVDHNNANYVKWGTNGNSTQGVRDLNRWYTYTVSNNGNYILKPVEHFMYSSVDEAGIVTTKPMVFDANGTKILNSANLYLDDSRPSTSYTTGTDDAPAYTNQGRAYGNDDTVYLTVEPGVVDWSNNSGKRKDAITDVKGVYTGIQNVKIELAPTYKQQVNERKGPKTDANPYGEGFLPSEKNAYVYSVYDNNYYIVASVVLGEAQGAAANYAYILGDVKSERVEFEGSSRAAGDATYYWEFEAFLNGEKVTLTAKTKYPGRTVLKPYHVQELRFDGDYVSSVKDVTGENKILLDNTDPEKIIEKADVYDVGHVDKGNSFGIYDVHTKHDSKTNWNDHYAYGTRISGTIELVGRTLYTERERYVGGALVATNRDVGLALRSTETPTLLIQPENGKVETTPCSSVSEAIGRLADADDVGTNGKQFQGRVVASLKDGVAQWVVIISDTNLVTGKDPNYGSGKYALDLFGDLANSNFTYNNTVTATLNGVSTVVTGTPIYDRYTDSKGAVRFGAGTRYLIPAGSLVTIQDWDIRSGEIICSNIASDPIVNNYNNGRINRNDANSTLTIAVMDQHVEIVTWNQTYWGTTDPSVSDTVEVTVNVTGGSATVTVDGKTPVNGKVSVKKNTTVTVTATAADGTVTVSGTGYDAATGKLSVGTNDVTLTVTVTPNSEITPAPEVIEGYTFAGRTRFGDQWIYYYNSNTPGGKQIIRFVPVAKEASERMARMAAPSGITGVDIKTVGSRVVLLVEGKLFLDLVVNAAGELEVNDSGTAVPTGNHDVELIRNAAGVEGALDTKFTAGTAGNTLAFDLGAPIPGTLLPVDITVDGAVDAKIVWTETKNGVTKEISTAGTIADPDATYTYTATLTAKSTVTGDTTVTTQDGAQTTTLQPGKSVAVDKDGKIDTETKPTPGFIKAVVTPANTGDSAAFQQYIPGTSKETVGELSAAEIAAALNAAPEYKGKFTFTADGVNAAKTEAKAAGKTVTLTNAKTPTQVWKVTYPGGEDFLPVGDGSIKGVDAKVNWLLNKTVVAGNGTQVSGANRTAEVTVVDKDIELVSAVRLDDTPKQFVDNGNVTDWEDSATNNLLATVPSGNNGNPEPVDYDERNCIQVGTTITFAKNATPASGKGVKLTIGTGDEITFLPNENNYFAPKPWTIPTTIDTSKKLTLKAVQESVAADLPVYLNGTLMNTTGKGSTAYVTLTGLGYGDGQQYHVIGVDKTAKKYNEVSIPALNGESTYNVPLSGLSNYADKDGTKIDLYTAYKVVDGSPWKGYTAIKDIDKAEETKALKKNNVASDATFLRTDAKYNETKIYVEGNAGILLREAGEKACLPTADRKQAPDTTGVKGIWVYTVKSDLTAASFDAWVTFTSGVTTNLPVANTLSPSGSTEILIGGVTIGSRAEIPSSSITGVELMDTPTNVFTKAKDKNPVTPVVAQSENTVTSLGLSFKAKNDILHSQADTAEHASVLFYLEGVRVIVDVTLAKRDAGSKSTLADAMDYLKEEGQDVVELTANQSTGAAFELPAGKAIIVGDGYALTIGHDATINGEIKKASSGTVTLDSTNGAIDVTGAKNIKTDVTVSGTNGVTIDGIDAGTTVSGSGNLTLAGTWTVPDGKLTSTGTVTVKSGAVIALGGGYAVPTGGTLTVAGTLNVGANTLTVGNGQTLTVTGSVTGAEAGKVLLSGTLNGGDKIHCTIETGAAGASIDGGEKVSIQHAATITGTATITAWKAGQNLTITTANATDVVTLTPAIAADSGKLAINKGIVALGAASNTVAGSKNIEIGADGTLNLNGKALLGTNASSEIGIAEGGKITGIGTKPNGFADSDGNAVETTEITGETGAITGVKWNTSLTEGTAIAGSQNGWKISKT